MLTGTVSEIQHVPGPEMLDQLLCSSLSQQQPALGAKAGFKLAPVQRFLKPRDLMSSFRGFPSSSLSPELRVFSHSYFISFNLVSNGSTSLSAVINCF